MNAIDAAEQAEDAAADARARWEAALPYDQIPDKAAEQIADMDMFQHLTQHRRDDLRRGFKQYLTAEFSRYAFTDEDQASIGEELGLCRAWVKPEGCDDQF